MFQNTSLIEFEDDKTIMTWLIEFISPENMDKIFLPNCIYSWYEIDREATRRNLLNE